MALYLFRTVPYSQLAMYFTAVPFIKIGTLFLNICALSSVGTVFIYSCALNSGGTVYFIPPFVILSSTNDTTNLVSSPSALSLSLFLPVVS